TAIARYKELEGHPVFKYNIEIIVLTNGKRVKIAEINCKDETELAQATEWVDFTLRGDAQ
ncbi:MAG: hypothetical protein EBR09_16645, partial [Proteobacteria bacterium]|nr:hypothetical protein [Pseudomonadota bacterium]